MRMVTINGEKVSPDREPEDWYHYRTDAFERLRKVASIDDLRALVEFSVGCGAYAIIQGSPFDEATSAALEASTHEIMDELAGKAEAAQLHANADYEPPF